MSGGIHKKIDLTDRSYSGIVKKSVREYAMHGGFKEALLGEVDVIISELVSNANKYAGEKCSFLYKHIETNGVPGLEIIYLDNGPGMDNFINLIRDGQTTTQGSLGEGLGAIFRLSDYFDMYSQSGHGTIILSRKYIQRMPKPTVLPEVMTGAVGVPAPGETACGDAYHCIEHNGLLRLLVADGLGHGPHAEQAARRATEAFDLHHRLPLRETIREIHRALKSTRGAVAMLCTADAAHNTIHYCGVGNIAAKVIGHTKSSNCLSHNGVVGFTMPGSIHESTTTWNDPSLFIIHSDGLQSRWNLDDNPGLRTHHPALIAAWLYKKHVRGHDDTMVVVVKRHKQQLYPFTFMLSS